MAGLVMKGIDDLVIAAGAEMKRNKRGLMTMYAVGGRPSAIIAEGV